MSRSGVILSMAIIAALGAAEASAGSKGYHVGRGGEFLPMRCTINGKPSNSSSACRAAAHRVHAGAGWSQASGPGVPAYYETGLPTPRYGARFVHNRPVTHQHRIGQRTYTHYGYLGHHENSTTSGVPVRIVHTGGGRHIHIDGHEH